MNHVAQQIQVYVSFGVRSHHSSPFAAEKFHKASIASFSLDCKPQAFAPSNGAIKKGNRKRNGITLYLNSNPTIVRLQAEARLVSKHNVIPFHFPLPPFIAPFEGAKAYGLQSRLNEATDTLWVLQPHYEP
ncbi:hypothetical protein TNCV_3534871 [Trichonephila clavipes]|nr:hypothetical protein TNCV_3534871 [Trichonephila clavipes]